MPKDKTLWKMKIKDMYKRTSIILKSDKLGFKRRENLRPEWLPTNWPEMTLRARKWPPIPGCDPCDRKRPTHDQNDWAVFIVCSQTVENNRFLFLRYSLYRQAFRNNHAVGIIPCQVVTNNRSKQFFSCPCKKIIKVEFRFDPGGHSLQVSGRNPSKEVAAAWNGFRYKPGSCKKCMCVHI